MNLIVLLKKLGYQTSWISNQSGWGKGDRAIVLLSQLCNNNRFTDARIDNDGANSGLHYDEEVLEHFDKVLRENPNTSKFIVLHLMGCHFDYEKRYPAARTIFTSPAPIKTHANAEREQNILNSYDNAMAYHDSIVNEIVLKFNDYGRDKNAALVFLSDHGEELYENRIHAGHSFPPTKETADIPYFTVLSPGFSKNYPHIEKMMKQRQNTAYSTENNFYTLIHLLNLDSKKYRNKILRKSLFSPYYDSLSIRFVMGLEYNKISS
ncbi:MAG: phosphoethanolamine transferase [Bacteroidia bacterium]|nr:phosphoethanolamine transferase [Bacteroidia bacterium]